MKTFLNTFFLLVAISPLFGQQSENYTWHNPLEYVHLFEGQGWSNNGFNRLPEKAKPLVRGPVWGLSRHTAGIRISFTSSAEKIAVQYRVTANQGKPHMPPTGVSGVDLYIKKENNWLWCRGSYQFKDTIRYDFKIDNDLTKTQEYALYLPLYNSVKDLRIGIKEKESIQFLPPGNEKPIVVYGTSIAQGACASRPGMAWSSIVSRRLNEPMVNLGFSGNGRLEKEMIELLSEIDASVYVLDCLPNLSPNEKRTKSEIQSRLTNSVTILKGKRANTPILLVQHAGYSDGLVDRSRKKVYETLNTWMTETFNQLKSNGIQDIYMLTKEEIALSNDAFIDGTHPTDLGMQQYAEAYEKVLRPILKKK